MAQYKLFKQTYNNTFNNVAAEEPNKLKKAFDTLSNPSLYCENTKIIAENGTWEDFIKALQRNKNDDFQTDLISYLLTSDREDAISLFKKLFSHLDPKIFEHVVYHFFQISGKQLICLLKDPELVSLVRASPFSIVLEDENLIALLKDDVLYSQLLQFGPIASDFVGKLYREYLSHDKVTIKLFRRLLRLKTPELIPTLFRSELTINASFWNDVKGSQLIGLGFMQLWQEIHPKSFNEIVVDENRDISGHPTPLLDEYEPFITEERRSFIRKYLLLNAELADQDLPDDLTFGIYLKPKTNN